MSSVHICSFYWLPGAQDNRSVTLDRLDDMQSALNVYRLILIKDRKHNITQVWDDQSIKAVAKDCLEPIMEHALVRVREYLSFFISYESGMAGVCEQ